MSNREQDSKRFTIQNEGLRFWTGTLPDRRYVLFGPSLPNILVYLFAENGEWIGKQTSPAKTSLLWDAQAEMYFTDEAVMQELEQEVLDLVKAKSITLGTIHVSVFFDEEEEVGIKELPAEFEEYLDQPEHFSKEDAEWLDSSIAEWRESGNFVFMWGGELWVSSEGEIIST